MSTAGHSEEQGVRPTLTAAEYRVVSVFPDHCMAHSTALSDTVKPVVLFPEVPAPDKLADVAADGAHRPDMRRSCPAGCLSKCRILTLDGRVIGNVLKPGQGAYLEHAVLFLDVIQPRNGLEVNHSFRVVAQYLKPHRTEKVGTAGEDPGLIPVLAQN